MIGRGGMALYNRPRS